MIQKVEDYYTVVRSSVPAPTKSASQAIPEVVDANHDGIGDMLVFGAYYPFNGTNPSPQAATLLLGKGDGTYVPAPDLLPAGFGTVHAREVVQGDFNEDGVADLFIADHGYDAPPFPGAQNHLLLGKASGGYVDATANLPQLSDFTHSAAAGDINGDGHLDLFVGNVGSGPDSYFLLGDGKGNFTRTNAGLPLDAGGLLSQGAQKFKFTASLLTDLNGDGRPELVLGNDGTTFIPEHRSLVFWNTGQGYGANNVSYLPQGYFGDARLVHDIAAMDIDGDGDNDLLLLSSETIPSDAYADGWALDVVRNDKASFVADTLGHFAAADSHEGLPNENSKIGASEFIRLMDVNGDGTRDVVITQFMNNQPSANTPVVWTNDGFGHFEVALRAGQLNTLMNDQWFVGVFNVPVMTAKGLSFTSTNVNAGTLYESTALASQMLPPAARITATSGNDRIMQNKADNVIDGGAGLDKVVYGKAASSYSISVANGTVTVRDTTGADGVDSLSNVERLLFADKEVAFDVDGTAGQCYRVYQAAFGRTPDPGGLGFWISAMDKGTSLANVAAGFAASPEFRDVYGANPTGTQIVQKFYQNVLHRDGAPVEVAYWADVLDRKLATVAEVLVGFSESHENQTALVGVMSAGFGYTPYP
ncbi:FG-GAP-like repeat-containing protein [Massilia agilis]|uniref:FG-GAP-like repeat-containing protein n=1 Tax=Massilia agilis TaxID=1811226 RepID=A0ABT2DIU1_9BURK|nr:FG-GAP-like repeat-containing protein [Massilia agilis]MCS0810378.1 FG-GAP-like repeat-containing protein [Massilia agilis]